MNPNSLLFLQRERESSKSNREGNGAMHWVHFQCRGVPLIWILVGQGPIALAVGAVGGRLNNFSLVFLFLFFLPLWETARNRLKYCLKGPLNQK